MILKRVPMWSELHKSFCSSSLISLEEEKEAEESSESELSSELELSFFAAGFFARAWAGSIQKPVNLFFFGIVFFSTFNIGFSVEHQLFPSFSPSSFGLLLRQSLLSQISFFFLQSLQERIGDLRIGVQDLSVKVYILNLSQLVTNNQAYLRFGNRFVGILVQ